MKKRLMVCGILWLIAGFLSAQTYDLQFVVLQNEGTLGGNYTVQAQIRAQSGSFGAGSGNFVFDFNGSALTFSSFTPLAFSGSAYLTMTFSQPIPNQISSLNSELNSIGNGTVVNTDWLPFANITYTIADPAQTSGLAWRIGQPNINTQLFLDNESALLSPGSFTGSDNSLPVALRAFTVEALAGKIRLRWTTESEVNNLGFEVYRAPALDGEYQKIASYENDNRLEGAGNSNTAVTYTFEDETVQPEVAYWYQIADVDLQGVRTFHGPLEAQALETVPSEYALRQNFPNPFNPSTKIRFEIPAGMQDGGRIRLIVYNSLGMAVKTLFAGVTQPGVHQVEWDGTNEFGQQMTSGIYFVRLQAGHFNQTRKMILLR
ncbi:MAG: T9SS type A sorting domain-containing protein [Calditrichaeota bacterium]|nr:T9SS type A sorting domain-containing protein [Calditrichota bacterium]MCB0303110.1 T9SS type A sorting domain-containing protein [Calditrichota bacterium]